MLALEEQQITPLRIKRMRVKISHWSRTRSAETIHQLATLLKAGLTLSTGLALLAEQHPSSQWAGATAYAGLRYGTGHNPLRLVITMATRFSAPLPGNDPYRRTYG